MKKILLLTLFATTMHPFDMKVQEFKISQQEKNVQLELLLDPSEQILKQTLHVSVDNPHATLGQISITPSAIKQYLPEFSDSKAAWQLLCEGEPALVDYLCDCLRAVEPLVWHYSPAKTSAVAVSRY